MGLFDLPRAMMLSSQNAERAEAFKVEAKALRKRAKSLDDSYGRALQKHFDKDLARFAASFARLHGAELDAGDLTLTSRISVFEAFSPSSRHVSVQALRRLVELSAEPDPSQAAGRPRGRLTLGQVRQIAADSGATSVAELSGAPATRLTLAWLGEQSPHVQEAGVAGGEARVSDIVVLPVAIGTGLWLARVGTRELAKQEKVAVDLKKALARLKRQRAVVDQIEVSVKRATKALRHLAARIRRQLNWLESVLAEHDRFERFTAEERHRLATLATLATAMTAVMACPLVVHVPGRKGNPVTKINDVLPLMVDAAEALLAGVPGGEPGDEAAGDASFGDPEGEAEPARGKGSTR